MNEGAVFRRSMDHLDSGDAIGALQVAESLTKSGDAACRFTGLICKGMIFEAGGRDFPPDLDQALGFFRGAAVLNPNAFTYCQMARVAIKQCDFHGAKQHLDSASEFAHTIDVDICYAEYYLRLPEPEYESAKRHFLRVALRGRYHGFFGYSKAARQNRQPVRALLMDLARLIAGPFLFLSLGGKTQDGF